MKTRDLLSICVVTDDDTGISQIGGLDFSINVGGLSEFLSVDTYERRNELFKWLGILAVQIDSYAQEEIKKQANWPSGGS